MSRPVRIEADASQELEAAALWYEARRPGLGSEFLASVDAALRRIAAWPQAGRPVDGVAPELAVRRSPVPGFPYSIAYLEMRETIRVLAFAHHRRKPNYWHERL